MAAINHGGTFYRLDKSIIYWTGYLVQNSTHNLDPFIWKRALKKSSVDWNVRVKDLRHFFGSFMLNRGVDHLTIVTLMGHSGVDMLKKRYGHFDDETLRRAVRVFDQIKDESPNCLQIVCKD